MSWKTVAEQQQSDLQQLQARNDGLNRTVVERENTIHDLRFRLASTEEMLASLESSTTNTNTVPAATYREFQRRLQAVEVEKAQLKQNADRAGAQLEYSLAEFRKYQQQAETQISSLRAKLAEYEQPRTNTSTVREQVLVSTNTGGNRNGPPRRPLTQTRADTARREDNDCPPYLPNDDQDDVEPDLAYMQKAVPSQPSSASSQPSLPATPAVAAQQTGDGQDPQTGSSTAVARHEVLPSSTNLPRARNQTNTTKTTSSPLPSRPAKQRGRRPKRTWSTFQADDDADNDDEYRPDESPERESPPPNPIPSKTRRLRKSPAAATLAVAKPASPTSSTSPSSPSSSEQETSPPPPPNTFPIPFIAVTTYEPPTTPSTIDPSTGEWSVAEHFLSEELHAEVGELWDRLAVVREKWDVFKGAGWWVGENLSGWLGRKSFTTPVPGRGGGRNRQQGGRVFKPACITKMAMNGGAITRWREGGEGRFACADCVASRLPCLTWSPRYEAVLLLPLHERDRVRRVEEGLEIRYWLNL
ncbi:hypothetical protein KC333_g3666 [Hortaea werneckii]|nr:hypothetical protein KC333_g3666 [Hortaea werneckii]KAI7320611.1 hypothetical protein KC326_g2600 [Hortaea werneckii]